MSDTTPSFPPARADLPQLVNVLSHAGVTLRAATTTDMPILRQLYAHTRADELAAVDWPRPVKAQFLESQFTLQHRHYVSHYADADFLALEQSGSVLGRLYLQRRSPNFLIVDITLLPRAQGQRIGRGLITAIQQLAADVDCGVQLHVDPRNLGARRLYQRLDFHQMEEASAEPYLLMQWHANVAASLN